ncbi:succinyl-diaminopimelate desuccinylase [Sulfolobales archaeon HS-7]|nr:succinyl-diaminopimelate desuccinylase [Sulfolobales archaeon HS-7]
MEYLDILKDLIEIPTYNPPGVNYWKISNYLLSRLKEAGFDVSLMEIPETELNSKYVYSPLHKGNPRYVVLARRGEGKPVLHFNAHYDTVPAGDGWEHDPFSATVIDGKCFGRGTADVKGGISAILETVKTEFSGTLEVSFVPDEESGGLGTSYLMEKIPPPDFAILAEPSFPNLFIGHKGILRGTITVLGQQAHCSRPWLGLNAFTEGSKFALLFLQKYEKILRTKTTAYETEVEKDKYPSINIGGITSSSPGNDGVVPSKFEFSFVRMTLPEESEPKEEIVKIGDEIGKELHLNYRLTFKSYSPGMVEISPFTNLAYECAKKVINDNIRELVAPLRYDGYFYRAKGTHTVNFGPGRLENAHAVNEYVSLREIELSILVYQCIMKKIL